MNVVDRMIETKVASLAVPMDATGSETCFQKANAWVVDTPIGSGGAAHRGGNRSGFVDHGHHAGFDLRWFESIGGYDEAFPHNEDAEYDHRLSKAGGEIWLEASVRLKYKPRKDTASLAKQYFNYGKGRARTAAKHSAKLKPRQVAPVLVLLGSIVSLIAAIFAPIALAFPGAYLLGLTATSLVGVISLKSICGLLAGPAAGIMHMTWALGFITGRASS